MVKVNVAQIASLIPRQMMLLKDARSDSRNKKNNPDEAPKEDRDGG